MRKFIISFCCYVFFIFTLAAQDKAPHYTVIVSLKYPSFSFFTKTFTKPESPGFIGCFVYSTEVHPQLTFTALISNFLLPTFFNGKEYSILSFTILGKFTSCLLYTSPSPRDTR